MANIAYVRVSSRDQNESRQVEALKQYKIDKWFTEKVSGKNMKERPMLLELIDWVREGDTVYVHDFSRLARNTRDLLKLMDTMKEKKVRVVSLKESLDTDTPTGQLMLTVIAAINEFERQNILERQAEGIAVAKKAGKYAGRKKIEIPDFGTYYDAYMRRETSKSGIAKTLHISRPTVDRLMEEYRESLNGKTAE